MYRHLRSLGALIALGGTAHAGGFTQPEGAHYAKVWGRVMIGHDGHLANGDGAELYIGVRSDDIGGVAYRDLSLNVYAEYGLFDGTTLIVSGVPYGHARVNRAPTSYVGPLGLGARQRLLVAGPLHLAIEGRYAWYPGVGSDVLAFGWSDAGDWTYQPTLEGHRGDAEVQAGLGLPFGLWATASAGGRVTSTAGVDPAILASGQLGWSSPVGVVIDAHLVAYEPLGRVESPANVAGTGQTRYLGYGFGASWWFSPSWAVTIGADSALYADANAAALPVIIGFEHRATR